MHAGGYRVLTWVNALVVDVPLGTDLGLLPPSWMSPGGQSLLSRGAIFPGSSAVGRSGGQSGGRGSRWGAGAGRATGW